MSDRNALIFVDFPSPDPVATAQFYAEVMDWGIEPHPEGVFHLLRPGGYFEQEDAQPSTVRNLNLGVYSLADPAPDPTSYTTPLRESTGAGIRVYVMTPTKSEQDLVLDRAQSRGATILWKDLYWDEFEGFHGAFRDPWGNQVVLWVHGDPEYGNQR